jgi:hypothetical protein
METKFWGLGFPFSSAVSFGEISNSARRRNSKLKIQNIVSGKLYHFYIWVVIESLRSAPSASASGISARATSA